VSFITSFFKSLFCVEPFPETPLQVTLLRLYVRQVWASLAVGGENGRPLKAALFGAGRHSAWLLQITMDMERQPVVAAVLDDSYPEKEFHGYPVIKPAAFDPASADLIILSSDTVADKMESKCRELFGDKIKVLNMYKELPPGPYYKEFNQFKNTD
jgi:hypothetical protein